MYLGTKFSTEDLPQGNGNFEPLPAGWYTVKVTDANLKSTKAGDGSYIAVRYDVLGPTHQGRVVFGNLNIHNPNPKAEEIGRQQLGDLMRAIGLKSVEDTDQLIGGECSIKLSIREAANGYEASNDIKGWKAMDGASMPAPEAAPAATAKAAPPWAKK